MQIFVINLDRHPDRLRWMEAHLADRGLAFTRLAGVEGNSLSPEQLARCYDDAAAHRMLERPLSLTEVGCALSHLRALQQIVDTGLPMALMLEDDALLSPELPAVLKRLAEVLDPGHPHIVLLNHIGKYRLRGAKPLGIGAYTLYGHYEGFNSHGYVITQAGARQMLEYFATIHHPIDYWATLRSRTPLEISTLVPYAVGHSELALNSSIEADRARKAQGRPQGVVRLARDWGHKYLYRKFFYQFTVKPFLGIKKQPHGGLESRIRRNPGLRPILPE